MKPDEQRIAISEACGYSKVGEPDCWHWLKDGEDAGTHMEHLPDYLNDLNAMQAAVDHMNATQPDNWNDEDFLVRLCGITSGRPHTATAAQWAEQFLKTLGKWKGEA
jgi:hypothetical protein